MSRLFLWLVFASAVALAACQSNTAPPANAAGLPPKSPVAVRATKSFSTTGPGLILSSWAGKDVLALMSDSDRLRNRQAETRALTGPVAQQVTWKNPDNNHSGSIVPIKDRYNADGLYCRDFQETVLLGDVQRKGAGTACQGRNGAWGSSRSN